MMKDVVSKMRFFLNVLVVTFVITFFVFYSCVKISNPLTLSNTTEEKSYYENRIIVGYTSEESIKVITKLIDGKVVVHIPELKAISIETNQNVETIFRKIEKIGDLSIYGIRYVEPVYKRFIEPIKVRFSDRIISKTTSVSTLQNYTGETLDFYLWGHRAIGTNEAWNKGFDGDSMIVAVLDTGVDGTHPDLQGQVTQGYRPKYSQILPENTDSSYGGSHGTHVAGIIAAKRDGKGIVGVAPKAKIMPIVIFDDGGWYVGDDYTAKGIVWAVDNGAKILSNSWGGWGYSQLLKDAFDYALERNVTVIVAAGNSTSSQTFQYPANYPGIIQVGAAEYNGGKIKTADFSSGSPMLTVSAPGRDILSTMPQKNSEGYDKNSFVSEDNDGYYGFMSGTSMATPHVSGIVALLYQKYPEAKPWQIRMLLEKSAIDIDENGMDERSGYGLLQTSALDLNLPSNGGTNFSVLVTDAYGTWKLPSVFVSLIGKSHDGRNVRYFAKTNEDGVANFYHIASGNYNILIGGPDSVEKTGLPNACYRKAEERQYETMISINSESENLSVRFSSKAILTLTNKPENLKILFEKLSDSGKIQVEKEVNFSTNDTYDFSSFSGKYRIKATIPQKATTNLMISGEIELNNIKIPISGVILKDATQTILSDKTSEWWTVFGNVEDEE